MAEQKYRLTATAKANLVIFVCMLMLLWLTSVIISIFYTYKNNDLSQFISIPLATAFYGLLLWYLAGTVTSVILTDDAQLVFHSLLGNESIPVCAIQGITRVSTSAKVDTVMGTNRFKSKIFDTIVFTSTDGQIWLIFKFQQIDELIATLQQLNPAITFTPNEGGRDFILRRGRRSR